MVHQSHLNQTLASLVIRTTSLVVKFDEDVLLFGDFMFCANNVMYIIFYRMLGRLFYLINIDP